jgi:hypothetical protein
MEVAGTQVDPATLFTPREQCHEMRWKGRIFIRHISAISHASPPWWWKRSHVTNARRSVLLPESALPPAYQWITYVRIHCYSLWMNVSSRMAWFTTGEEQSKPNFSTQTKPQNFDQSTCGKQQSLCFYTVVSSANPHRIRPIISSHRHVSCTNFHIPDREGDGDRVV